MKILLWGCCLVLLVAGGWFLSLEDNNAGEKDSITTSKAVSSVLTPIPQTMNYEHKTQLLVAPTDNGPIYDSSGCYIALTKFLLPLLRGEPYQEVMDIFKEQCPSTQISREVEKLAPYAKQGIKTRLMLYEALLKITRILPTTTIAAEGGRGLWESVFKIRKIEKRLPADTKILDKMYNILPILGHGDMIQLKQNMVDIRQDMNDGDHVLLDEWYDDLANLLILEEVLTNITKL
jgi:hypothetical protein